MSLNLIHVLGGELCGDDEPSSASYDVHDVGGVQARYLMSLKTSLNLKKLHDASSDVFGDDVCQL